MMVQNSLTAAWPPPASGLTSSMISALWSVLRSDESFGAAWALDLGVAEYLQFLHEFLGPAGLVRAELVPFTEL